MAPRSLSVEFNSPGARSSSPAESPSEYENTMKIIRQNHRKPCGGIYEKNIAAYTIDTLDALHTNNGLHTSSTQSSSSTSSSTSGSTYSSSFRTSTRSDTSTIYHRNGTGVAGMIPQRSTATATAFTTTSASASAIAIATTPTTATTTTPTATTTTTTTTATAPMSVRRPVSGLSNSMDGMVCVDSVNSIDHHLDPIQPGTRHALSNASSSSSCDRDRGFSIMVRNNTSSTGSIGLGSITLDRVDTMDEIQSHSRGHGEGKMAYAYRQPLKPEFGEKEDPWSRDPSPKTSTSTTKVYGSGQDRTSAGVYEGYSTISKSTLKHHTQAQSNWFADMSK